MDTRFKDVEVDADLSLPCLRNLQRLVELGMKFFGLNSHCNKYALTIYALYKRIED